MYDKNKLYRYFILLLVIMILGGLMIFITNKLSLNSAKKEVRLLEKTKEEDFEEADTVSSTSDTIQQAEFIQPQPEIYDESQMFFDNILVLYDYFMFGQVEDIKDQAEIYIHRQIAQEIMDAKVLDDIRIDGNKTEFDIELENKDIISITVTKNEKGDIIKTVIYN